jgi:putative membrane protein
MIQDIIITVIYSIIGVILMMLGTFLVDLAIPCEFPTEIKKRNVAVGYITAGVSISVGIILKSAIMSPVAESVSQTLLEGIGSTVVYFIIGMVVCISGYLGMKTFNTKYDLNKEIEEGNPAAGLMVMGMFIGLAIVISGVIY